MATRVGLGLSAVIGVVLAVLAGCAAQSQPTGNENPTSAPAAEGLLRVVKAVPAGTDGWDYITVDSAARRVYVARSTRVEVFDADSGALVGTVTGVGGAHGVALVPEKNEGYATAGKDGTIIKFDLKTLKPNEMIIAGKKPDAILYDPASKCVFAFNHGDGDVIVVNPATPNDPAVTIPVGGTLEFAVADGAGRVYVNVEDKNEVAVIDTKVQMKVVARWPVAPGEEPTGLAIDVAHRRLFVGCGNKKMVVLDADNGKVLATLPVGAGVDGVAFDPQLNLAMSADGKDGTLTAVREVSPGKFAVVQTLTTAKGARTIAVDPKTHTVYLPCLVPGRNNMPTFGLLLVGPAGGK
jgi:DNA-binding beta-propeller fold protein YncE